MKKVVYLSIQKCVKNLGLWSKGKWRRDDYNEKIVKWLAVLSSCLALVFMCGVNAQAADYSIATNDSWVSGGAEAGESNYSLLKSVTPASATNKKLSWTSDNTDVAKVDANGKVTAKGVGAATITASAMDGSKVSVSCQIIVKPARTKITACRRFTDRNVYVKVKKQSNVSGIQYQMGRTKKFNGRKSSYYAGAAETTAKTAILSKNKTYYFRVRMYIDYGGKRYYGAWSTVKKVKTKRNSADYGYFAWKNV